MWALRFLNGPLAGKSLDLADGIYSIGRADSCQVHIPHPGISKQHAQLVVRGFSATLRDLGSSNGTFVNGVRVSQRSLQPGDKIGFHDVLIELVSGAMVQAPPAWSGNAALQIPDHPGAPDAHASQASPPKIAEPENIVEYASAYFENVALPGVYKLIQTFEFKWVLGFLFAAFILLVTALSVIPMVRITKSSIEKESTRRALTIARNLALINQPAIQQELESTLSTQIAEQEEGVDAALVVAASDGHIMAPATKAESYADNPFVHRARKSGRDFVEILDGGQIGASVPIRSFNPELGTWSVKATAIVLYSAGALSMDTGRMVSLFTQTLLIAFLLGGLLYVAVYRMVLQPAVDMNIQLDHALKEGRDQVQTTYLIPEFQRLALNISSALTRSLGGGVPSALDSAGHRTSELANVLPMITHPGIVLGASSEIVNANTAFEDLVGMRILSLQGQSYETLQDQALKLNLADLLEKCRQQPGLIHSNQLDFNGIFYEIDGQGFSGPKGIEAFLVLFKRKEGF